MKIQEQVCTLEQAKKLKALGIKQESFFTWYGGFVGSEVEPLIDLTDQRLYDASVNGYYGHPDNTYSAFTTAELGLMMDLHCNTYYEEGLKYWHWQLLNFNVDPDEYPSGKYEAPQDERNFITEAEARADMVIYLIENNVLPLNLVNIKLSL